MSEQKRTSKAAPSKQAAKKLVNVGFDGRAREYLFFNLFRVEVLDHFLFLSLFYRCPKKGLVTPVFYGCIYKDDIVLNRVSFQNYLTKLGFPGEEKQVPFSTEPVDPPHAFNHLGFCVNGKSGEIVVQQFVRWMAVKAKDDSELARHGVTHGAYTSTVSVHKALLYEVIEAISEL